MELIDLAHALRSVRLADNLILSEFSLDYVESSLLPICNVVLVVDDFAYSYVWPGLDHYYLWAVYMWIAEQLESQIQSIEFNVDIVGSEFYTPNWATDPKWINLH